MARLWQRAHPLSTEIAAARKRAFSVLLGVCGVVVGSLVSPSVALANTSLTRIGTPSETTAEERPVSFFFSDEAWGGLPFSAADKQKALVDAMVSGQPVRLERDVVHLLNAPEAHVSSFVAVFEVDGRVRPPTLRAGYELELLVRRSGEAVSVELINGDTGVVNVVRVAPED